MGKAFRNLAWREDEPREDVEFKLCAAITLASRRMHARFENQLRPHGQTLARWKALRAIAGAQSGITLAELSDTLGVTPATLVKIVDDLEARGQVRRRPLPGDRRANLLFIEPAGREAMEQTDLIAHTFRTEAYRDFAVGELQAALTVLERLAGRFGAGSPSDG